MLIKLLNNSRCLSGCHRKIMHPIILYTVFYEYKMYNHNIKTSFVRPCLRHLLANKPGFNLKIVYFYIRGKLFIIRCEKKTILIFSRLSSGTTITLTSSVSVLLLRSSMVAKESFTNRIVKHLSGLSSSK